MRAVRKLQKGQLEVGKYYVVYNPNSAKLAANGDKGILVKLEKTTPRTIKVELFDGSRVNLKLNEEGAFAYLFADGLECQIRVADESAFPSMSERMKLEGWNGKVVALSSNEIYLDENDESPHKGTSFLRIVGETIDPEENEPYINTFLMSNVFPHNAPEWIIPRAERMGIGAIELPLPPKPVAQGDVELLEGFKEALRKLNEYNTNNVSIAFADKDGNIFSRVMDGSCHSGLVCHHHKDTRYILSIGVNRTHCTWNKGLPNEEAMDFYINYLINYSHYADVFICKDVEYVKEFGYVVDATQPGTLVAAGLYASRQIWERQARAEAFLRLYKEGIPLHLSFLFGATASLYKNGKMKFTESGNHHSHLYTSGLTQSCLEAFVRNEIKHSKEDMRPYHATRKWGIVDRMWGATGDKADILKELSNIKNAFGGLKDALPVEEAIEQAADAIDAWRQAYGF